MNRIKPQGNLRQKAPVVRDKAYMEWMKQLCQVHGCVLCKAPAERAHIRYGESCQNSLCGYGLKVDGEAGHLMAKPCQRCNNTGYRFGKLPTGMSERDDPWTIPLCPEHHRLGQKAQHAMSERMFWALEHVDPLAVCKQLQDAYPDLNLAIAVLERAKES